MPHLPAEEAPGSPPLRQLVGRLAGRVAVTLWRLVQAHQIIQKVHLSSMGVTTASSTNLPAGTAQRFCLVCRRSIQATLLADDEAQCHM